MKGSTAGRLTLALSALWAAPLSAHDIWELSSVSECVDDLLSTCNQLIPGVSQVHDIQGTVLNPDADYMLVETKARRSYEVDVRAASFPFEGPGCVGCPEFDRLSSSGALLTAGSGPEAVHPFSNTTVRQVIRWAGGASDQRDFIRVSGPTVRDMSAGDRYEIVLRDTTLAVPRWNNSATQSTIFLISNQAPQVVTGNMFFYGPTGALLETIAFTLPRFGVLVAHTYLSQNLAGQSGSATVTHNAGYGELAGKAVSLEPGTGFTFDSQMTYVPY